MTISMREPEIFLGYKLIIKKVGNACIPSKYVTIAKLSQ